MYMLPDGLALITICMNRKQDAITLFVIYSINLNLKS